MGGTGNSMDGAQRPSRRNVVTRASKYHPVTLSMRAVASLSRRPNRASVACDAVTPSARMRFPIPEWVCCGTAQIRPSKCGPDCTAWDAHGELRAAR